MSTTRIRQGGFIACAILTTLSVSAVSAPAIAVTVDSADGAQVAAVPNRKDSKSRPVVLVHGFNSQATNDCAKIWRNAKKVLKAQGFTGGTKTFGYYKNSANCDVRYRGTAKTSLNEVGRQLAWQIFRDYSSRGKPVDVMAHSMGGLVVKAAINGVNKYGPARGWPQYLYVEDVVALGSPHRGVEWAKNCAATYRQCKDMSPGSAFLRGLPAEPRSKMGTDHTFMGSTGDKTVGYRSAINAESAKHWAVYRKTAGELISHSGMRTVGGGKWNARYRNKPGPVKTRKVHSPLVHAAASLYRHKKY